MIKERVSLPKGNDGVFSVFVYKQAQEIHGSIGQEVLRQNREALNLSEVQNLSVKAKNTFSGKMKELPYHIKNDSEHPNLLFVEFPKELQEIASFNLVIEFDIPLESLADKLLHRLVELPFVEITKSTEKAPMVEDVVFVADVVPAIIGEKGERGQDGTNGENGHDGRDGVDGRNGIDGTNGKSALELLNEENNTHNTSITEALKALMPNRESSQDWNELNIINAISSIAESVYITKFGEDKAREIALSNLEKRNLEGLLIDLNIKKVYVSHSNEDGLKITPLVNNYNPLFPLDTENVNFFIPVRFKSENGRWRLYEGELNLNPRNIFGTIQDYLPVEKLEFNTEFIIFDKKEVLKIVIQNAKLLESINSVELGESREFDVDLVFSHLEDSTIYFTTLEDRRETSFEEL